MRWLSSIGKCQKSLYWNIKYEQIIYTPVKLNFICRHRVRQTVYIHTTYGDINHLHEIRPGFWSTLSPKTFLWDGTENPWLTKSRAGWKAKLRRRLGWDEGVALINVYAYWNNTEKMTTYSSASKYHAQQSIS